MKRIAVFSDTHGNLDRLDAAMLLAGDLDGFLHLGDFASDARRIADKYHLPYHAVQGNCDMAAGFPHEQTAEYEKAALFLTHGHSYPDIYALANKAESLRCAAALFGHTHEPLLRASGPILIVNPGSLSRPRFGSRPSFCVLTIDGAEIHPQMLSL